MKEELKEELMQRYSSANASQRKALREIFGQETFVPEITRIVRTFEDAANVLDGMVFMPDLSMLEKEQGNRLLSFYKLMVITEALNEGWTPDWSNERQYKWFVWWHVETVPGSFTIGLTSADPNYTASINSAVLGSRLCFKSQQLAEYAAKQFRDLYQDFLL